MPSEPFPDARCQEIAGEFFREGGVTIPGVLEAEEVAALRAATDRSLDVSGDAIILRRARDCDPVFDALVFRQPWYGIVAAVLGPDPAFNAMNVIRNPPGKAISYWHVDDVLEFPLPPDIPRFDPRIRMPVWWLTVQIALSDIDRIEHGPTQFVPRSHHSGRRPDPDPEGMPTFEGRGPESVFCRAGDIYLTNHQTWHRGAPNVSDRVRYVLQVQYAARWADRRFRGLG